MDNRKVLSKLRKKPLSPMSIPKTSASYEALLLNMMSKLYDQQKITNKLLTKLTGEEDSRQESSDSLKHSEVHEHEHEAELSKTGQDFRIMKKQNPNQGRVEQMEKVTGNSQPMRQLAKEEKESQEKNTKELQGIASTLLRVEQSLAQIPWKAIHASKFKSQNKDNSFAALIKPSNQNRSSLKLIKESLLEMNQDKNGAQAPVLQDFLNQAFNQNNQSLKKKSYNILSEILPYSDRREIKIRIPFDEFLTLEMTSINILQLTEEWLGTVCRATASICWSMLSNKVLSFDEVKILFNENIVFNFIEYMQIVKQKGYDDKRRAELARFINETSIKILEFLCKQYPLTKIEAPNIALRSKIRPINEKGKVQFDMVGQFCSDKSTNITLTKKASGLYTSDIMRCINQMLIKSKDEFQDFEKTMKKLFNQIFIPKNEREKERKNDNVINNPRQKYEEYYDLVKAYTKVLIGCKINKNTEVYSEHEIENGIFYVKSTSVLRIITKWLESLQDICKKPYEQIKESKNQFKDHNGNYIYLDRQVRNEIYKQFKANQNELKQKIQSIKDECYKMEVLLTEKQHTQDLLHPHLGEEQSSVGKYCSNLKSAISSYICSELNEIMDFLLEIPLKTSKQTINLGDKYYNNQAKNDLNKVNLVYLKIFDLLRCKCVSKESEITYLLGRLYEKHQDKNDPFRIMRIKDRLGQGTRDILLNVQFQPKGLVGEIQIAVISNSDQRQQLLDQYSHFLYELQRAELGPLSQNASIWGALEQKAIFFEAIKKQSEKIKTYRAPHKCVTNYNTDTKSALNINFQHFVRPFICFSCKRFFEIPKTCLQNVKCNKCKQTFCGECHLIAISEVSQILRKKFIFESNKFSHFLNYLTEYTDFKKPFPENGFIIRKTYLKKQLIYYRVIPKEIEDSKSSKEKQKRYQIEMTSTVIEDEKIQYKIVNKKQMTVIKINGDYILSNDDKKNEESTIKELQELFIFSVNLKSQHIQQLVPWEDLLKKFTDNMKVMNLIKRPIYPSDLNYQKMNKKQLEELNTLNNNCLSGQLISYYLSGNKLILLEIKTDEKQMGKSLQEKSNLNKLVKLASQNISTVDLEYCKIVDEITEEKLLPALDNNVRVFQQFYENIKVLNLNFCQVVTISFVQKMISLQKIYIQGNQISSLKGVENLLQLNFIRCSKNQITDLEPLQKLKELTYVGATNNRIKSLKGITNLKNLKVLSVTKNKLEKVDDVEGLNIEELFISENDELSRFPKLESLKSLRKFYFGSTKITDFTDLKLIKNKLECLAVEKLILKTIPPVLNQLTYLLDLTLQDCDIFTIENLSELKALTSIDLRKNKISDMKPLEHNTNLTDIKLTDNNIRDIVGVRRLINLRVFEIKRNPLETFSDSPLLDFEFKLSYTESKNKKEEIKASENFDKEFKKWKDDIKNRNISSDDEA